MEHLHLQGWTFYCCSMIKDLINTYWSDQQQHSCPCSIPGRLCRRSSVEDLVRWIWTWSLALSCSKMTDNVTKTSPSWLRRWPISSLSLQLPRRPWGTPSASSASKHQHCTWVLKMFSVVPLLLMLVQPLLLVDRLIINIGEENWRKARCRYRPWKKTFQLIPDYKFQNEFSLK